MYQHTRFAALLTAALLTASLTACGSQHQTADPSADSQTAQTDTAADSAQETRILPIASSFDPTQLDDCTIPVCFTNDDITQNESGQITISMSAWEQELFDSAEVTNLKTGDILVVRGKDITVESIETVDGVIQVNGGEENDGVDLAPSESGGTFYESTASVCEYPYTYVEVAQLSLPVNPETFVYRDSSDLEKPEQTYTASDLISRKDEIDFSCTELNSTAHIVNGAIEEITRVYTP